MYLPTNDPSKRPELGVVLYLGEVVEDTVCNDMSASGILRQNPLYLTATKVFERYCAVGPAVASTTSIPTRTTWRCAWRSAATRSPSTRSPVPP